MRYLTLLLLITSCAVKPPTQEFVFAEVENRYYALPADNRVTHSGVASADTIVFPAPADTLARDMDYLPPRADAGKDDTIYFPRRHISLKGRCTGATSRQWTVLRTSLPAPVTDSASIDLYKIYVDYRLTCRNGTQVAYDDKRITLVWEPKVEFTIIDMGRGGKWAVNNDGSVSIVF
jgi:hypothetical protein